MKPGAITSKTTLLALLGAAFSIAPSLAQQVPRPQQNDILIGFRQGEEGYLINVGPASVFANATPGTFTLSGLGNIGTDLEDYNTTRIINPGQDDEEEVPVAWHQRADFFWGAIGLYDPINATPPIPGKVETVYISKRRSPVSTQSTPWNTLNRAPFNTTLTNFTSVIHTGGYPTLSATPNSPVAAKQPSTVAYGLSYAKRAGSPGAGNFDFFAGFEATFANGAAESAIDLYQITRTPNEVSYLGYFTISTTGTISFTKTGTTPPVDQDSDGDGFTDEQEELAGTDPNDPNDFFRVETVSRGASGDSALAFNGVSGRTYTIEYSTTLQSGDWTPVATIPVTATSLQNWTDPDPSRNSGAKGFYRIIVSLTP